MITISKEKRKERIERQHKLTNMKFKITHIAPLLLDDFPIGFIKNQNAENSNKFRHKFRLLDGDKNIYFEGLAIRNDSFEPLDFLGSEYGCTDIQYFENGKFVSL
jgi:hypothetical protein